MRLPKEEDPRAEARKYKKAVSRTGRVSLVIHERTPKGVGALLLYMEQPAKDLEALAVDWGRLAGQLPQRDTELTPAERAVLGRFGAPDRQTWPILVGREVAKFPALVERVGVDLEPLTEATSRSRSLEFIHHLSGRAKDGALDLRLTAGAYGWFQVTEVLSWIRRNLDRLPQDKQRAILRDFGPLLVLLTDAKVEAMERREELADARRDAAALADEEERKAEYAEALLSHNAGRKLSAQELLELAIRSAEDKAGAARGTTFAKGDKTPVTSAKTRGGQKAAKSRRVPRTRS